MFKYVLGVIFFCVAQHALAYTSLTVFGDSHFDGGDSATAVISYYKLYKDDDTKFPPYHPYSNHRFTNGPTIAEYLAENLNLNGQSQFFNYAVGGATTEEIKQIAQNAGITPQDQDLYLINGGGNDFSHNGSAENAVQNILHLVADLNQDGAKNIVVMNLPVGGPDPSFVAYSEEFNSKLSIGLTSLDLTSNTNLKLFDLTTLFTEELAITNGFTNIVSPCFDFISREVCSSEDEYLFWDYAHFTTRVHSVIALELAKVLAVPEPESYAMFIIGLGLVGFVTHRKK